MFCLCHSQKVFGAGHLHFPCPLLLTTIHFGCQWVFSATVCALYPVWTGDDQIRAMTWREWITTSVPCGLVTSGDVGLSNLSLVSISITFYTMVKSSTPIFVLTWAYIFGIERITWSLLGVVAIIALGEFLTVMGEVDFKLVGFLLCLGASLLSGARWTLVQLKLHTMDPPMKSTIGTMKLLAPSMFFSLLSFSLILEQPWNTLSGYTLAQTGQLITLGLFGGFFAILMILCEFYLIIHATAMMLMIGGVIKEMITICIGVLLFGDQLNPINIAGIIVVMTGVFAYKVSIHLERTESAAHSPVETEEPEVTMILDSEDTSENDPDEADVIVGDPSPQNSHGSGWHHRINGAKPHSSSSPKKRTVSPSHEESNGDGIIELRRQRSRSRDEIDVGAEVV